MNPLISVIITSYNQERYIESAINSVLCQTYTPIELIMVDGGSTDNTYNTVMRIIRNYRKSNYEKLPPNIKSINFHFNFDKKLYASGARNEGVKYSKGELIAFLDGDDEFYPDAIETLYKSLPHSCQMIYGDFYITSSTGEIIGEHIAKEYRPRMLVGRCYIHIGAVLMRKSIFDIVGYFDETLHMSEDIDYWCRIALANCNVAYVKAFIMKHRHWRGSISQRGRWKMDLTHVLDKYYDLFKKRFK